jgi:hypothetical protein
MNLSPASRALGFQGGFVIPPRVTFAALTHRDYYLSSLRDSLAGIRVDSLLQKLIFVLPVCNSAGG